MELFRRERIEPPRILAIDDVRLTAPLSERAGLCRLYVDVLRLEEIQGEPAGRLVLRGLARSGPRLIIEWDDGPAAKPMRRQALLQVKSFTPYVEMLADQHVPFEWSSGWFFF